MRQIHSPTLTLIDSVLTEIVLPPLPNSPNGEWSRKAASEYLGLHRETLAYYLDHLCTAIPDFRREIRLNPVSLEPIQGFGLKPYQMWVALRVTNLMRVLHVVFNGRKYRDEARKLVFKYREHFSRKVFESQQLIDVEVNKVA